MGAFAVTGGVASDLAEEHRHERVGLDLAGRERHVGGAEVQARRS